MSRGMANWSSDYGYIVLQPIKSSGTPGCVSDTTVVDEADEMYVTPMIRLQGESQLLLNTSGASNSAIFGSTQPSYSTVSKLRVKQTRSGGKCTWTVLDTEGVTYTLGQVRIMETKNGKKKHAVLITGISDVFGNFVNFTYSGSENRLRGCLKNRKFKIFVNQHHILWPRNMLKLGIQT